MKTNRDPSQPEPASTAAASGKRVVSAELIIATLALVASACASVAAIVQTREAAVQTRATLEQNQIVAKQLGASVWPYLTIDQEFAPHNVTVSITNQGLGPALIRTFRISIDGRARPRLHDVLDLIDPNARGRTVDESEFGGGSVLRPDQTFTLFSLSNRTLNRSAAQTSLTRAAFDVCYCSLLEECWSLDSQRSAPRMVRSCGPPTRRLSL